MAGERCPDCGREQGRVTAYSTGCNCEHECFGNSICEERTELAKLREENARLQKLFDDAGEGEYNVLALVEHYQAEAIRTNELERENARLKQELEDVRTLDAFYTARTKRAVNSGGVR